MFVWFYSHETHETMKQNLMVPTMFSTSTESGSCAPVLSIRLLSSGSSGLWSLAHQDDKVQTTKSPVPTFTCLVYKVHSNPGSRGGANLATLVEVDIPDDSIRESQRYVHIPMWPILSPHHPKKTSQNIMDKSISGHISHIMSSLFNHFQGGSPWILRAWLALWPSTALRVDGSPEPHGSLPHGPQRSCRGVVGWDAHGNPQVPEPVPMASACYTAWWYT